MVIHALRVLYLMCALNTRNLANMSDVIIYIDCIPRVHEYTPCQIKCFIDRNKVNIYFLQLYFVQNIYSITLLSDPLDEKHW